MKNLREPATKIEQNTEQSPNLGTVERVHRALRITPVPAYPLGDLVIGASSVPSLLAGMQAEITFVQQRRGRQPFLGFAGTARLSRSQGAITFRIDRKAYSASAHGVADVYAGELESTPLTLQKAAPAPVIDADLVHAF